MGDIGGGGEPEARAKPDPQLRNDDTFAALILDLPDEAEQWAAADGWVC